MDEAANLYLELCKLPIEEQRIFLNWARLEINKLDKEQEQERKRTCEVSTSTEKQNTSRKPM